jgi:hypothetical protein
VSKPDVFAAATAMPERRIMILLPGMTHEHEQER